MKNKMMFWLFVIFIFVFTFLVFGDFGSDSEMIDCINCVHGTSSGNGICKDCNGNHFEDKGDEE